MAAKTEDIQGIVLKKTRLGESDLIITLLVTDGSQIQVVAKGARKPKGAFSSYFELFNVVKVMYAKGRGLGIVKEAGLVESPFARAVDPARTAAAQCMAELALKLSQPELSVPKFFALTETALFATASADVYVLTADVAAYFIKAAAMHGIAPSFTTCAECGASVVAPTLQRVPFSVEAGGALCSACVFEFAKKSVPVTDLTFAQTLLKSTFAQIADPAYLPPDAIKASAYPIIDLMSDFITCHLGIRLKSPKTLPIFIAE
jgi:DNA repair protein RecO (recombination protein O)